MAGLTAGQYYQVAGIFGLSLGAMLVAAAYLLIQRSRASPRYRPVVTLSTAFCLIAGLDYAWLCWTWTVPFTLADGVLTAFRVPFNEHYRYADWLITVPLQLVAFALLLDTPPHKTRVRAALLAFAGAEMVLMGYIGEVSTVPDTRWVWFAVGLVPFALITAHLYRGMGRDIAAEQPGPRQLLSTARLVLVMCWPVYAAIFALQTLGFDGARLFVPAQAAYTAADIGAKIVFAVLLCRAAVLKSAAPTRGRDALGERYHPSPVPAPVA